MKAKIPTLTADGYITNPAVAIVTLFKYFLASNINQSAYYNDIRSLRFLLANSQDIESIKINTENYLYDLYIKYFDKVNVTILEDIDKTTNTYHLDINVIVDDNGKKYELKEYVDGTVGEIPNFNDKIDKLNKFYNKE